MNPAARNPRPKRPASTAAAKMFTIAAGQPFTDALAAGILDRVERDPLRLAKATVLVPTRRARRSLADAFLRQGGGRVLLLPRMMALGDLDEDEILLTGGFNPDDGGIDAAAGDLALPPALGGLRRQLMLARLVRGMDEKTSPDQAANLALELARLLDQVSTERLSFDGLAALVPDDYAAHWQRTLKFLTVLTEHWPKVIEAEQALDAAERRNRVLDAQARLWTLEPPADPVIAAGSTGSIPATANLLSVVARLPAGAVVLPGLDKNASPEAWEMLQPHHPQFGMARLLDHLGVDRDDVQAWPAPGFDKPLSPRARLVSAALTPADAALPALRRKQLKQTLAGVAVVECPGAGEEAAVIALVMRRALNTPGRTAALVTPDRGLARRVAAELERWHVAVDDSAGQPLARTPPGAFMALIARMIADRLAPVPLLAVLKHPLAGCGMEPARLRTQVRTLEVAVLRGPRPAEGVKGLRDALKANREFRDDEPKAARDLDAFLKRLDKIVRPLVAAMAGKPRLFVAVLKVHVATAVALAASSDQDGPSRLWDKDAGEAAANFVAELADAGRDLGTVTAADYPALLETLMAARAVRPRYARHPRLHIWGLLEARLQQADVMILGGLNEGTWPAEANASPWMSRPMLKDFGLPPPERRIGLAAHDFAQAFAAPDVVLTRATRVEGTPQVPSRWLLRLENLFLRAGLENAMAAKEPWLEWVAGLDKPKEPIAIAEPRPAPPLAARPRRLPVTAIETWLRDPYALYARRVLGLKPLDPIDAEPGAAERGIIVHDALERFIAAHRDALPDDALSRLIALGRQVFDERLAHPGVRAFWWPRFERIARWFVEEERRRRAEGIASIAVEVTGEMNISGNAGPFTLTARADRIDRRVDDGLVVIDYKTGQTPSVKQMRSGLAPQLPLEAAIAAHGGFAGVDAGKVAQLVYFKLSGGREPGKRSALASDVGAVAAEAVERLTALVRRFDDPKQPYLSKRRPMQENVPGDYDHLARFLEWRGGGDGDE